MENLYQLISEGIEESPEFKEKLTYWVHKRKKNPETKWLIAQLVEIYGVKEVQNRLTKVEEK